MFRYLIEGCELLLLYNNFKKKRNNFESFLNPEELHCSSRPKLGLVPYPIPCTKGKPSRSSNPMNNRRPPNRSVSALAVSNVAEFLKFSRRRRAQPNEGRLLGNASGGHHSFAAGVLAASKNFRPFNPAFQERSRRRSRPRAPVSSATENQPPLDPVVSFAAFHDTYGTLGLHEYSREEKANTWYSREELAVIERDRQKCIRLLEKSESLLKDVKYSGRGLEKMTLRGQQVFDRNRQLGLDVVFEEQDALFRKHGTYSCNPDIVAASYRAVAIRCHRDAHRTAKKEFLANHAFLMSEASPRSLPGQAILLSASDLPSKDEHSDFLVTSSQSLLSSSGEDSQHPIDMCSVTHSDGSIASAA